MSNFVVLYDATWLLQDCVRSASLINFSKMNEAGLIYIGSRLLSMADMGV
jgi:hypothetical protein